MNKLRVFSHKDFGGVRALEINGQPWFVGKDVASALGYGQGKSLNNAVSNHIDPQDKGVTEMVTPGGKQNIVIINKSGLYSLIFSSKLPKAKEFTHWVTSEVLPNGMDTWQDEKNGKWNIVKQKQACTGGAGEMVQTDYIAVIVAVAFSVSVIRAVRAIKSGVHSQRSRGH